jgi:hypothetical protein
MLEVFTSKSILYVYQTLNEITMKKKVFYNWACNLIFELQWPFAIHYIFTPMSGVKQFA